MAAAEEREFSLEDSEFDFLVKLVYERVGIVLGDHKRNMVYGRLARRLRQLKIGSFKEYCALLSGEGGADEMGNLVNAITTNLTSFFREAHHFEHLRGEVLAPLAAHPPADKRLRIWSAGCSSGAEPYSIAMTVLDALGERHQWDARILATDIDTAMLNTCRRGEYSGDQREKIPTPYRKRFLQDDASVPEGKIRMSPALRDMIRFNALNLLESWPFKGPFDVIFCRNVVIYFDKETQKKLFARMAEALKPQGWLYIGHSENLFNVTDRFALQGRTIYRKTR